MLLIERDGVAYYIYLTICIRKRVSFYRGPHLFLGFAARFQLSHAFFSQGSGFCPGATDRTRPLCLLPHNTLHIPTTSTRLSCDNIYEFNNTTLILINNETINKHYHEDQQHHG